MQNRHVHVNLKNVILGDMQEAGVITENMVVRIHVV